MRYIINTEDTEGLIGIQIAKWAKEKKIELIEKGEPVVEIQAQLERVAKALETLKKAGYNSEVMRCFVKQKTKLSDERIAAVLDSQAEFFKQIGIKI